MSDNEDENATGRRARVTELLREHHALNLVAHPDESDDGLRHVYVHDPDDTPLFVGVCAAHAERVLLNKWLMPWPTDVLLRRDDPTITVYQWPDAPKGYPTGESP